MNRRELLQCATLMISGLGHSQLGFSLTAEQRTYLATAPDYTDREVDYFSSSQRKLISAIAEAVIPATDTPGAIDAGVPRYIELMVSDWFTQAEQRIFIAGLEELQANSQNQFQMSFDELDAAKQERILEQLEHQAGDSSWYEPGNVDRAFVEGAPFICQVKELTVWGFFTSEVGAKQVLRHNPMPMRFDGDVPLDVHDSSWTRSVVED